MFNKVIEADKLFLTSDLHINHANYCKGVSSWDDKSSCREFPTIEEMNDIIIANINSKVPEDAILLHLGDFIFGDKSRCQELRDRINCQIIHHIYGNHDDWMRDKDMSSVFASCQDYLKFYIKYGKKKQQVIASHYGMRVWDTSHKGSWLLFGHSHSTLPMCGKSMDVGLDTNNMFPYSAEELRSIMDSQPIHIADHHNSKTN